MIEKVIVGHSHNHCLGRLGFIQGLEIESISCELTRNICKAENLPVPATTFEKELILNFHGEKVICRHFGGGHTLDNIVVYFPKDKVLFGGCLIKSLNSRGLGYTGEADIENWDKTIEKIIKEFSKIDYVIPGHGKYGDSKLLSNTIKLVKMYKKNIR